MIETKIGWWKVKFEITLEGEDAYFDELSEETQEHIVNCIKDGCFQGQIVEEEELEDDDNCDLCGNDCANCAR